MAGLPDPARFLPPTCRSHSAPALRALLYAAAQPRCDPDARGWRRAEPVSGPGPHMRACAGLPHRYRVSVHAHLAVSRVRRPSARAGWRRSRVRRPSARAGRRRSRVRRPSARAGRRPSRVRRLHARADRARGCLPESRAGQETRRPRWVSPGPVHVPYPKNAPLRPAMRMSGGSGGGRYGHVSTGEHSGDPLGHRHLQPDSHSASGAAGPRRRRDGLPSTGGRCHPRRGPPARGPPPRGPPALGPPELGPP